MLWARIEDDWVVEISAQNPAGCYHPSLVWMEIPAEWQAYVDNNYAVMDGEFQPPTLDYLRGQLKPKINAACDSALATLKAAYPETEVLTWDQQIREAEALQTNAEAAAPLVRSLAAQRPVLGETETDRITELTRRILANAEVWSMAAGNVIGQRQALEDALDSAESVEDLLAVNIAIHFPEDTGE